MSTGRNELCPCGSGKKFKHCCLQKQRKTTLKQIFDKLRRLAVNDYFDFLTESLKKICPYAFDYMPISIDDEKDKSFFIEIDRYFNEHHYEYGISMDHLVFDQILSEDLKEINWLNFILSETPEYFTSEERDFIQSNFDNSRLSLFEIIDVDPGESVLIKDLFTDQQYQVIEHKGSEQLQKYDCILSRVITFNKNNYFGFILMPILKRYQHDIIKEVKKNLKIAIKKLKNRKLDINLFLKNFPFVLVDAIQANIKRSQNIQMKTTTGEDMKFCTANYKITDYDQLVSKLNTIEEFNPDGIDNNKKTAHFFWFGGKMDGRVSSKETNKILNVKKSHFVKGPTGNVSLGHFNIDNNKLKLECNSEKRLKWLMNMLDTLAGDIIKFESQDIKSPNEMMMQKGPPNISSSETKEEIPMELQQEAINSYLKDHYKNMFTQKIPILGNKSPKECIKTPAGKKLVYELLKEHENNELHKKAQNLPWFDINQVYKMWGIPKQK